MFSLKIKYPESAIFPSIDNKDHNNDPDYKKEITTVNYDPNSVLI